MPEKDPAKELSTALSQARILLAADVDASVLKGLDLNTLVTELVELHKNDAGISIANKEQILAIAEETKLEKSPRPVEVLRQSGFSAAAADIDSDYHINQRGIETTGGTANDFVDYFRNRFDRLREAVVGRRVNLFLLPSIDSTRSYTSGREVAVVGMVSTKSNSKAGNLKIVLEDETGELIVVVSNGTSKTSQELFETAKRLVEDDVVAIKGKLVGRLLIANEIIWPDVPIKEPKTIEDDIAIAFMSDIHVGSKQFMEKNFSKMLKWLNGEAQGKSDDLAGKIKYIIIAGDVADGVGVYPDQEYELAIPDIYLQYRQLFSFMELIPDYIDIFMMPGNHDAVGRAEPQQPIGEELSKDFKIDNLHIVSNPCYITVHGVEVLAYHGTSLDSIIRAVPGTNYSSPEKAMIELLKRRHLSPIYGGNVIVPSKTDQLVIDKIPDVLHMGHIHKNAIAEYHGVKIVNSGTWQGMTKLQQRMGHNPTPCRLPVYEPKTGNFSTINFDTGM